MFDDIYPKMPEIEMSSEEYYKIPTMCYYEKVGDKKRIEDEYIKKEGYGALLEVKEINKREIVPGEFIPNIVLGLRIIKII